jgi:hypothetical protein
LRSRVWNVLICPKFSDLAIKSLEYSDQSETPLLYSLLQQVKFLRSRAWNVRSVRSAASIAIWATYLGSIFLQNLSAVKIPDKFNRV